MPPVKYLRRRKPGETPPAPPPFDPEKTRSVILKAVELSRRLERSTEELNNSLERLEDALEMKFGEDAFGWVQLEPGLHLVYREGLLMVETIFFDRNRGFWAEVLDIFKASRSIRIRCAHATRALLDDILSRL